MQRTISGSASIFHLPGFFPGGSSVVLTNVIKGDAQSLNRFSGVFGPEAVYENQ